MQTTLSDSPDFARAFGDALQRFLQDKGISQTDAAKLLGLKGRAGRARLSTYCHDSRRGTRAKPTAQILYLACTGLGFKFEYNGYTITAAALEGARKTAPPDNKQIPLDFHGQFDLPDNKGSVSFSFRRPPGRVEMSVALRAAS